MAKKIDVKLLLELRQANMSQRAIASTRHISSKSVASVWRRADELGISLADVTAKTPDEVYMLFFPEKFRSVFRKQNGMSITSVSGLLPLASRHWRSSTVFSKAASHPRRASTPRFPC